MLKKTALIVSMIAGVLSLVTIALMAIIDKQKDKDPEPGSPEYARLVRKVKADLKQKEQTEILPEPKENEKEKLESED